MKWRSLAESAAETEIRSLREIYAERKALIDRYVPAEIRAVHERAVRELQEAGIAEQRLKEGALAPAFELPDQSGKLVTSASLLKAGALVVFFVRGRWCPFCVGQLEAMNAVAHQLRSAGASLIAISPQTVHQNYLMADQHRLQFPVLSDGGNKVAKQFGIVYRVPEYQREIYQRVFVNLPHVNGEASWGLPVPATFILKAVRDSGEQAEVRFAYANPDYTQRPEPGEIAGLAAGLGG
jgi:peroxiredoxin